ncbi:phytoene desaturase family protein [Thermodesulfobacteriota bacterium]
MQKYDDIVVGTGISGLTLALLLGLNGKRVLLLEKGRSIGGSMARFKREGIPFDTGFHFTGGFVQGGILSEMLTVLGIAEAIRPVPIERPCDNRLVFEDSGSVYDMPTGYSEVISTLKRYFPDEENCIDTYFRRVRNVCENTVSMNLRTITDSAKTIDEDYTSLEEVLSGLTSNLELKAILSTYAMCYGTKPSEISFANHSRVCYPLYCSVARVEGGGEAFISAFRDVASVLDIETRCNTFIVKCADVSGNRVQRFVLNSGDEVCADRCTFTIHPFEILKTLPHEKLSKAFRNRIESFEPSIGIFSVYAVVEGDVESFRPAIISRVPFADVTRLLDHAYEGANALVITKSRETIDGKQHNVLIAFEPSFPSQVARWADSKSGRRPPDYYEYKQRCIDRIKRRVLAEFPMYREGLRVLDAASMLTFRDYLHSPYGCAYGIRQKIGQFNLFGKMPLRNLYAAGQSAVLPGLVGAMLSSFIVGRSLVGKEQYRDFIERQLGGAKRVSPPSREQGL